MLIYDFLKEIKSQTDELTNKINIEPKDDIKEAVKQAELYENTWNKVKDAVVVFSDLKNSTKISFDNTEKTMSKLLEMLNKPFIDIHTKFGAEFIDMKGDGGIAIYSPDNYLNSILAAITVNSYYKKYVVDDVRLKYKFLFIVETGIATGDLLVKRVGIKKNNNNFFVWSGETVNKAALISKKLKEEPISEKFSHSNVGITRELFEKLFRSENQRHLIRPCCSKFKNWHPSDYYKSKVKYHYNSSPWCPNHGQELLEKLLVLNNIKI